jgi:hypothetical protein
MKTFDLEDDVAVLEAPRTHGQHPDLFSTRTAPAVRGRKTRPAPELAAARVLSRQLPRKRVSAEKKRIIHLICLNLVALLKRRSEHA